MGTVKPHGSDNTASTACAMEVMMTLIEQFIVIVLAQLVARFIVWLLTRDQGGGPKQLP